MATVVRDRVEGSTGMRRKRLEEGRLARCGMGHNRGGSARPHECQAPVVYKGDTCPHLEDFLSFLFSSLNLLLS